MRHGRKQPYTTAGIRRLPCSRAGCPNKAEYQWQVCSDGRLYRPMCPECDYEVNRLVLEFMGDPDATVKLAAYRQNHLGLPPLPSQLENPTPSRFTVIPRLNVGRAVRSLSPPRPGTAG